MSYQACTPQIQKWAEKASGTRRASQAVPHPSTDRALRCLTSEFGWDRVYSSQYGRWRNSVRSKSIDTLSTKTFVTKNIRYEKMQAFI